MNNLYRIFILITIIAGLAGCGSAPVKDERVKAADKIRADLIGLTAAQKIQYAEKLFNAAVAKPVAEKNRESILALKILTELMQSSETDATAYVSAQTLAEQIISQITPGLLGQEQMNQYILSGSQLALSYPDLQRAMRYFQLSFNSVNPDDKQQYQLLQAKYLYLDNQPLAAVKALITRYDLLTTQSDRQENSLLIWKYLGQLSNQHIEEQITSAGITRETALQGWLQLAQLFRTAREPSELQLELGYWEQQFPAHQATRNFIDELLELREKSILKPARIAVLLPMKGNLAKPAKPIINGIIASHYDKPLSDSIILRFYDSSDESQLLDTYQQAIDYGADIIIGPLAKTSVSRLMEKPELEKPTLALNNAGNNDQLNKTYNLYQYGLSPEDEARIVALKARQQGHYYAAVMTPDSSWGKRMQAAFSNTWEKQGGVIVSSQSFPVEQQDFSQSIKALLHLDNSEARKARLSQTIGRKVEFTPRRRQDVDMIFMAAFPDQARQIPLQVIYHRGETIPVYATSHIVANYDNNKQNLDLDGVTFVDMPWLVGLNSNAVSLQGKNNSALFQRLFALGVDSYQLAPYIRYLENNPEESFPGETGQLSIEHGGSVIRDLPWAVFNKGEVKPGINSNAAIH